MDWIDGEEGKKKRKKIERTTILERVYIQFPISIRVIFPPIKRSRLSRLKITTISTRMSTFSPVYSPVSFVYPRLYFITQRPETDHSALCTVDGKTYR